MARASFSVRHGAHSVVRLCSFYEVLRAPFLASIICVHQPSDMQEGRGNSPKSGHGQPRLEDGLLRCHVVGADWTDSIR